MKKGIAVLLVAIMALSLFACTPVSSVTKEDFWEMKNDRNVSRDIVGTWKLESSGGEAGALLSCVVSVLGDNDATYEFRSDGTGVCTTSREVETFTYHIDSNYRVTFRDGSTTAEVKISGGKLYIISQDDPDILLVFKRK